MSNESSPELPNISPPNSCVYKLTDRRVWETTLVGARPRLSVGPTNV